MSAFSLTFASRFSRSPTIADLGLDPFNAAENYPAFASLLKKRIRKDLQKFNSYVVISSSLANNINQKCQLTNCMQVVIPGIDKQFLNTIPKEKSYILYLGRLDIKHKGIDYLIEAFANIIYEHPDIKLYIAGSGPDKQKVYKMIKKMELNEYVKLLGLIEGKEKTALLSESSFVCMPSRQEGWPQVALEAAACAKPVVGYNIPGLRDAVVDNYTGLLVEPDNVAALINAMKQLIENKELRNQLGKAARERSLKFSWEHTANSYEALFKKVITQYSKI